MPRPRTISREHILESARELFLAHGFAGVTSAQIARRAQVSEGSIYKRFQTKELLFFEAMKPPAGDVFQTFPARSGQDDVGETLQSIALDILSFFEETIPRVLSLLAHAPAAGQAHAHSRGRALFRSLRLSLAEYFAREMTGGRIRACDPDIPARMLVSAMHSVVFARVAGVDDEMESALEPYVAQVVGVLLEGLLPCPGRTRGVE